MSLFSVLQSYLLSIPYFPFLIIKFENQDSTNYFEIALKIAMNGSNNSLNTANDIYRINLVIFKCHTSCVIYLKNR